MAKCPNCSVENADTQRFCGECGTPLSTGTPGPPAVPSLAETVRLPAAELPMGTVFAKRYQVIEELGMGGMGRVYRVLDKKLEVEIALKLIRPEIAAERETLERFKTELKLAREVVHINVARMFDFNEEDRIPYITMEYVRGENLKRLLRKVGRLFAGQAIPIACQICEGLAEAHRLGIVHRDLKPQNIMIDEDGQAKIMDFGLARFFMTDEETRKVATSGTPAYMSPEQVGGLPLDGRSDLYSLGVLIYEMLTGTMPFKAASARELIQKHLTEPPADPREINPGISSELSQLVMKCLDKDPAKRYQSADEVREALDCLSDSPRPQTPARPGKPGSSPQKGKWLRRWLSVAEIGVVTGIVIILAMIIVRPGPWKNSLAVLPIEESGTEEKRQNVFAGLQSEITDRLSSVQSLRVLPVPTVNSFDLKGKASPEVGKMLGVKYLLRLTLEVEGNRVSAKIYLINARRDSHPPPLTYSKDLASYRVLQDEISRYTARALGVALAEEQLRKIGRRGTDNIEAYNFYLEGMKLLEDASQEEDIQRAIEKYRRAIEIDPNYALAHWGLGNAYENLYHCRRENKDPVALENMYEFFNKASQLDPTFAETNLGLGWYYFNKGDNPRAFDSFKKALALEPRNYIVNRDAGAFLRSIGLYKQAVTYLSRAVEISAHDSLPFVQLAQCRMYLGQCDKALLYAEKAIAVKGGDPDACAIHAILLALTKKLDEADLEIKALENMDAKNPNLPFLKELATAIRGEKGKTSLAEGERPTITPQGTYAYLLFDMKDEAISNIEAGIEHGFLVNGMYLYSYPSLIKNPWYKGLRDNPRFQAILNKQKELYLKELKALEKL